MSPAASPPPDALTYATIALAAVAALTLAATVALALQTRRAVSTGQAQATASEQLARVAQLSREDDHRPWLVYGGGHTKSGDQITTSVRNVGRGHAFTTFAALAEGELSRLWTTADPATALVGDAPTLILHPDTTGVRPADVVEQPNEWTYVCEDGLGVHHRFRGARHDAWRRGEPEPSWVTAFKKR